MKILKKLAQMLTLAVHQIQHYHGVKKELISTFWIRSDKQL